ncbi:MAG: Na+/H+ antiporter NhaA [Chitinophagales bacterium]|nr:Na+/H+ antiporter NhaA [Chitinophagales bacterium]
MENRLSTLFTEFFQSEKAGGFILIGCTIISLLIANSSWGDSYIHFWHEKVGGLSIEHWINDGLMAVFFLLVGLEIERELYVGELSEWRNAMLPIAAALGGMLIPAIFHFAFNTGTPTVNGFGIPMATDIAFALGILSLAGNRVPVNLKIFLTALAIIDDLGAILVIALFYTDDLNLIYLFSGLGIFGGLYLMGRLGVQKLIFYILPGLLLWFCFLQSGVHATISGVLLAFAIPFGKGDEGSPSYRLQHFLHKPVAFFILPVFALANTGIVIVEGFHRSLFTANSLGIMAGLVLGKPIGVLGFSWLAVKIRLATLPLGVNWSKILVAGIIAGIGFTMSIFITLLAFSNPDLVVSSKMAILLSSIVAALLGWLVLYLTGIKKKAEISK